MPCKHGNKSADSIYKCREFLEYLKNYKLFKKESGPTNYLDKTRNKTRNIVTSVNFVLGKAWPNLCSLASTSDTRLYRGADKSLARPASRCIFLMVRILYLMLDLFYIYIYIYI